MDIQQNIFQYFNSNPNLHILFVFNNMFVLDDLESMQWPEDYEFVIFDGKYFETKYRLEKELANKRVILCFPNLESPRGNISKETFPLLDLLCEHNGQTLGQLCDHLDMARQSVTQHLGLLEDANLISTVRRGREKLHFINPVPLHEVYERWVRKFEQQRLSLLHDLKRELEGE